MAKSRQRMFIYDRKEVTVLTVLGVLVALFAFTLGVHLGKKVRGGLGSWTGPDAQSVDTSTDKIPEPGDLTEQSKGAFGAVDDTLSHMLRDEVEKAGLKLDQGRQIDLPKGQLSGLIDAERVLKRVKGIAFSRFSSADVVRHPLVARIVDAYDAQGSAVLRAGISTRRKPLPHDD